MHRLYIACLAALLVILSITFVYRRESTVFYGIAETREIVTSSEHAVEIKKLPVVEGQEIRRGDLLVELARPDLTLRINEITHKLDELNAEKSMNANLSQSKINAIQAQIKELEARYELNRKLTAGLKSIKDNDRDDKTARQDNPFRIKIESLKKELAYEKSHAATGKNVGTFSAHDNPVQIQIRQLWKELETLRREREELAVHAQFDGVIGSVNFKIGEKVAPYSPILTLHTSAPSYVKGYIHENIYHNAAVGQELDISSVADRNNRTVGTVVGVGSRIVEYPVRLRKRQDFQIWGREIVIKIPADNRFLLGEKLLISPRQNEKGDLMLLSPGEGDNENDKQDPVS